MMILEETKEILKKLFSNDKDIAAVYLFGSIISGNQNKFSDIDIAILYSETLSKQKVFDLSFHIENLLQKKLPFKKIDLINLNNTPIVFAHNIIATGELIVCNDREHLIDFIYQNNYEYLDFIYYKKYFNQMFLDNFKSLNG